MGPDVLHKEEAMVCTKYNVRIWFAGSFGHNRNEDVCMKSTHKTESNIETQNITWKTHNSGKNHDSPRAIEYTIWEEYKVEEKRRGNDLLSSFFATRGGYNEEATTSLSLLHALYN